MNENKTWKTAMNQVQCDFGQCSLLCVCQALTQLQRLDSNCRMGAFCLDTEVYK